MVSVSRSCEPVGLNSKCVRRQAEIWLCACHICPSVHLETYEGQPNKPPTDPNPYRPISLLSIVGKLFERIIASRLSTHVDQKLLLPDVQFGFCKKHSTISQLARITDYISNGFKLHKHTGMVSLDLEKAYDTMWI